MNCRGLVLLSVLAFAGIPAAAANAEEPSRQSGEIVMTKSGAGAGLGGPVSLEVKRRPALPLRLPEGWYVSVLPEFGLAGGEGLGGMLGATARFERLGASGPFEPMLFAAYQHFWLERQPGPDAPCIDCSPRRRGVAMKEAVSVGGGWILDSGFRGVAGLYLGVDAGLGAARRDDDSFVIGPRYQLTGGVRMTSMMLEARIGGLAGEAGWLSLGIGYRARLRQ